MPDQPLHADQCSYLHILVSGIQQFLYKVKEKRSRIAIFSIMLAMTGIYLFAATNQPGDSRFVSYTADPQKQDIRIYWKDDKQERFSSIQRLKTWVEKNRHQLVFAMNAGMYRQDNSPQGLLIEKQKTITPLDTSGGSGNFYLKPNGVFYITTNNQAFICTTGQFENNQPIAYATQSGPMLLIDGQIHPVFSKGSANLNIRNGVGILPGNKIIFAMSKQPISLYDFADYFKSMGCKNALYLDGFVSRAYLPAKKWIQLDGDFGALIGITAVPGKH
jgi:uncharacterized protein YigE (DUF2233 family)